MSKKLYEESDVQAIANAIRTKNGLTDTYTISQMAAAITAIETGGGGLPSGWATGEFTPAEDMTGDGYEIPHGLGKIPNFIFIYSTATELKQNCIRAVCYALLGEEYDGSYTPPYDYYAQNEIAAGLYDTSTKITNTRLNNLPSSSGTTNEGTCRESFFLPWYSSRYYAAGVTYKWIAIRTEE